MANTEYSNGPLEIYDFDVSKLTLGEPKPIGTYGTLVPIKYNGKNYVPYVVMPNLTLKEVKQDENGKFKVKFSFTGKDEQTPRGERLRLSLAKLKEIDERICQLVVNSAQEKGFKSGFLAKSNEKFDADKIRSRYRTFWYQHVDENGTHYPETIRCKLLPDQTNPKAFSTMRDRPLLQDKNNVPINVTTDNIEDILSRNSLVKPVLRPMSLFVKKGDAQVSNMWGFFYGKVVKEGNNNQLIEIRDDPEDEATTGVETLNRGLGDIHVTNNEEEYEEVTDDDEYDEDAQLAAASR